MASSFNSPSRSPGSARLQLGSVSRLRSSAQRKPPEPLRRAVADCLSSSSTSCPPSSYSSVATLPGHHHANPSGHASEASRTLRDYLAAPSTTDVAYCVILDHTLAERERSPAVVARCVTLLKRYLLRYKPSEETLQQIDRFCLHIIAECDHGMSRRLSSWSHSLGQQSSSAKASTNSSSPLPVSSFASGALVKSVNYVRSLVAQHIPKRSFQPAAFAGAQTASRQSLPSLSSLLSKSFNSHLSPASNAESSERKDTNLSIQNLPNAESNDGSDDLEYIASDVLRWRWAGEQHSTSPSVEGDHSLNSQELSRPNFLEVGAAALFVADMDAKIKGQPWRHFGTAEMPYLDQLLQPSSLSTSTCSASARHHLRIVTASKRTKLGAQQIWEDSFVSTFCPRARQLFHYRHYSEQQPLRLNPTEVGEVIAAVCSEAFSPNAAPMTITTLTASNRGKPSIDVAVSVLVKLVIDMYVVDSETAAPLTLSMLEDMVTSPRLSSRTRSFDLILNLAVHAHLLEPVVLDQISNIEEDYSQESYINQDVQMGIQRKKTESSKTGSFSAIENFELWILNILYEILIVLVQIEEKNECVWASALSCLLYFVCDRGKIRRSRLKGLDIRVMKALVEISRMSSWADAVHNRLISMLTSMFYQFPGENNTAVSSIPIFLADQVDLIGGIEFVLLEYSLVKTREERRNLYLLLFDYVLHQINLSNIAAGVAEYGNDEVQPLASLLSRANAPEAFHISVKLGVHGIGELLRRSIASAMPSYRDSEQQNIVELRKFGISQDLQLASLELGVSSATTSLSLRTGLLEKITANFDSIISSFTHLEKEFYQMREISKSYKFMTATDDAAAVTNFPAKANLSWATLHSLLHSDRIPCRRNGYIWLGDLLVSEISKERGASMSSNIKRLQQQIAVAGQKDSSNCADIPLSVSLMCGLLQSKNIIIRAGFLFVLEVLLMRCKFLLDENELESSSTSAGDVRGDSCLEKANLVIDIMSSSLSLVAQINETDHFNILKMCDILFSQLCLQVPLATSSASGDVRQFVRSSSSIDDISQDTFSQRTAEDSDNSFTFISETSPLAALLLQGRAVVPMQLVARVPAVLFYWPLIQLAGAATDNIALGISVGSKGRGNLPGATSDIRAALLLLLIAKCTADSAAFQEVDGEDFFRQLLDDTDSRVAYYSSAFLLKRMMTENFEHYQRLLQNLVLKAQQSNNEKLLENPYLQMRGILHLSNDLGTGL